MSLPDEASQTAVEEAEESSIAAYQAKVQSSETENSTHAKA